MSLKSRWMALGGYRRNGFNSPRHCKLFQGKPRKSKDLPTVLHRPAGPDKGGVEGRGKGIRLQEFTPSPRGESLAAINA